MVVFFRMTHVEHSWHHCRMIRWIPGWKIFRQEGTLSFQHCWTGLRQVTSQTRRRHRCRLKEHHYLLRREMMSTSRKSVSRFQDLLGLVGVLLVLIHCWTTALDLLTWSESVRRLYWTVVGLASCLSTVNEVWVNTTSALLASQQGQSTLSAGTTSM